jgi:hypothetical protein
MIVSTRGMIVSTRGMIVSNSTEIFTHIKTDNYVLFNFFLV